MRPYSAYKALKLLFYFVVSMVLLLNVLLHFLLRDPQVARWVPDALNLWTWDAQTLIFVLLFVLNVAVVLKIKSLLSARRDRDDSL